MDEEYEIIFIPDEGRAILNKKTKKVYYSEFEIVEEKNDKIDKLQSNWNSLREWLEKQKEDTKICKEWNNKKGFNDIDYERDIKRFEFVLDKMNELEGVDNESN